MFESDHGFFFRNEAYFYLCYKSDKLFLYVTDKNICHNSILIVIAYGYSLDTAGYKVAFSLTLLGLLSGLF